MNINPAQDPGTRLTPVGGLKWFAETGRLEQPLDAPVRERNRRTPDDVLTVPARLDEGDRPAALAHFLRLSEADRRMRFLQVMSDQAIETYVGQIDLSERVCFGVYDAQQSLVALAEAIPYRSQAQLVVEAAFSTDEAYRRNGLARALCESLGEYAADRGVARVTLHCDGRNKPMRELLRAIDAVTHIEEGELEAEWDPTQ
jgi:RimJ/RimL family protein N-acetyltransferase